MFVILLGGICMFYDAGKVRLNAELYRMESQVSVFGSEERKALRVESPLASSIKHADPS